MTKIQSLFLALGLSLAGGAMSAPIGDTIRFNANATPGVIYGSGNTNGGWSLASTGTGASSLELGLRAKVRYDSANGNQPANVWNDVAGSSTYLHEAGLFNGNRARWNFDWSITTGGPLAQSGLSFVLDVDRDSGNGTDFASFNVLSSFVNWYAAPGGSGALKLSAGAADTVLQNSQNPGFGVFGIPGLGGSDGAYTFRLSAFAAGSNDPLARSEMTVVVGNGPANSEVPEPAALALIGAALLAAGAARRRR